MNKTTYAFIIIGLAVLGGIGYVIAKPQTAPNNGNSQQESPPTSTAEDLPEAPGLVEVSFNFTANGYEPKSVRVDEGQTVMLKITSDVTDEAHLHGYDKVLQLQPNQESTIEFTADKTGRFELELHELGKPIGAIEVYPK